MKRIFLPLILGLALSAVAPASPNVVDGEVTVSHGFVTRPDGTKVDITGMTFPVHAVRINAKNLSQASAGGELGNGRRSDSDSFMDVVRRGQRDGRGWQIEPVVDTAVYDSNFGSYGYIEGNPSSLDDLVLSPTAVNKPWTTLSFGIQYGFSSFSNFLIRWRIWDTAVDKPAGMNDFSNEIADFGVIWNQSLGQGSWYVTINIQQAAVVCPDTTVYFAQQFRTTQPNGEGPFIDGIDAIFNASPNPPAIGSSEDQFWFDSDPLDGIYENSEIDIFEGSRADLALDIAVNSSAIVNTLLPSNAVVTTGTLVQGNANSLWFEADDDFMSALAFWGGARTSPVVVYEIEANSPTATPLSIRYDALVWANIPDVQVTIELYNYLLSSWVQVDQRTVGQTPVAIGAPYGGAFPLSWFVSSSTPRKVKARVSYKNLSSGVPRTVEMKIDKFVWTITR